MATATAQAAPPATNRYTIDGVSFATYLALRADLDRSGRQVRMAFDRGTLEIMAPLSYEHNHLSSFLHNFIIAVAFELRLPIAASGSTTLHRDDLDRGAEPDESFYFANAPRVRGHKRIDLPDDPPPDLVMEVDVSRSSVDKLAIYAALGVGEFWRLDDGMILLYELVPEGEYRTVETSRNLPTVARSEIEGWIRQAASMDFMDWLHAVHNWSRETLLPRLGE